MGSREEIAVGDDIVWWCGPGGHGIAPGDQDATRYSGRVTAVHRHPADPARVVAYSVLLATALCEWLATARPGHHPTRVDAAGEGGVSDIPEEDA